MRFSTVFTLAFIAAPILAAPMPKKITNTSLDTAGFNGMIDELQIEKYVARRYPLSSFNLRVLRFVATGSASTLSTTPRRSATKSTRFTMNSATMTTRWTLSM